MKKCLSALLALVMLLALALPAAATEAPAPIAAVAEAENISKYGNVRLDLTNDEIKAAGYAYGDVVTVEFLGQSLDLPLCRNYSDMESGSPALFALDAETQVYAAVNMGNFAAAYGIAEKTTHADGTYTWKYCEGVEGPVAFTITMKEAGGYYDEYVMRQLSYTNDRADYPQLTDAQFANFRAVSTSGMGKNILYRTASPVDPEKGRSPYADAAIRAAGVTVVMNLSDDPTGIRSLGGYDGSYYATTDYIALSMDMDFSAAVFEAQLAEGLRFLAANPGVYAVHCLEGKDRTGFVIALLECLMGAAYDEVVADYMTTYYNYYGVTAEDPRYAAIANGNIAKSLCRAFGVADLQSADLAAEAAEYLEGIGLSDTELAALKANLSVSRPFTDVAQDAWYASAVAHVYETGLMNGVKEGVFMPDGLLTRARLLTVLWRMAGEPEVSCALPADIRADAWYAGALRWAASLDLTDADAFEPNERLTREDAALLLWNAARCLGADVSVGEDTNILSYNDAFDISEGKAAALQWAVGADVMEGDGAGNLDPQGTLTRAQAAVMLTRLDAILAGASTPNWSAESPAMRSLVEFVTRAVDESSDGFIPEKDRIAVFDMDGTLTCETFYTYYDTMMFIEYCLNDHPERVSDELKQVAASIRPGYTADENLARNFAKAYAGMTVEELYQYAVDFGKKYTESFRNMRYIDGFYLPMVELVRYLYENGFTIYVVSGTERTTTRAIVANSPIRDYVTPNHVIGTEFEVKQRGHEEEASNMDYKYTDGDELVITGGFVQKNLNSNKVIFIEREIGQRPVLAFGNSGSDTSMMNYTIDSRNPYPAQAYMVVADDGVREWGAQNWEKKSADYLTMGYVPISMKDDFARIYPEEITKAETQYRERDRSDASRYQENVA